MPIRVIPAMVHRRTSIRYSFNALELPIRRLAMEALRLQAGLTEA